MTCDQVSERIMDFTAGALPEEEAAALKTHVKDCAECWQQARDMGAPV